MADLMMLDKASGRLVRKSALGFDHKGNVGGAEGGGGGGGSESSSPVEGPKRKPLSAGMVRYMALCNVM